MELGETFLLKTPPKGNHLFVVAIPLSSSTFLLFPVVSFREYLEQVCVLEPSAELPDFIEHKSVVDYKKARQVSQFSLNDMQARGFCNPKGKLSTRVHMKILSCALASKRITKRNKRLIREFLDAQ